MSFCISSSREIEAGAPLGNQNARKDHVQPSTAPEGNSVREDESDGGYWMSRNGEIEVVPDGMTHGQYGREKLGLGKHESGYQAMLLKGYTRVVKKFGTIWYSPMGKEVSTKQLKNLKDLAIENNCKLVEDNSFQIAKKNREIDLESSRCIEINSSREIEASVSDLDAIDQYVDKLLANDAPHVTKDTAEAMKASLRKYFQKVSADKIGQFTDEAQAVVEKTLKTLQEARPGEVLTTETGTSTATARTALTEFLETATGAELPAKMNMDFFLRVAKEVAFGAGRFVGDNSNDDLVQAYPALELVRFDHVFVPRGSGTGRNGPENGWEARWQAACDEAGDDDASAVFDSTGRMVAMRDSDVWQSLGDGAGGYTDTLGNKFAPFAWNSGMDTKSVSRKDCIELGLMDELDDDGNPTEAKPAEVDFGSLFGTEAARCPSPIHNLPLAAGAAHARGGLSARFHRSGLLAGRQGAGRAYLVPFRRRLLEVSK